MTVEIVDATRLRDSLQCLRYYYYRHERHLVPIMPRMPLVFGSGVHASLAKHYEGCTAGLSLAAFEEVWEKEVVPFQHNNSMLEDDQKRNPLRWLNVFMLYREHYKVEPFSVLQLKNGKAAVEVPFFLPLTDDLALAGVIDLLIQYLGQIMVVDHKTTSYINTKWIDSFNPNHQFTAYLLAANELLQPAKPITTLLVNAILTHATEKRPEKLFSRPPTTRSVWQLEHFKKQVISWWTTSVRQCRAEGVWPQNDDRCQRWPGGCDYHSLCTDVEADPVKVIPSSAAFRVQIWDPIHSLRDKGLKVAG
jgi:hypothetical protein